MTSIKVFMPRDGRQPGLRVRYAGYGIEQPAGYNEVAPRRRTGHYASATMMNINCRRSPEKNVAGAALLALMEEVTEKIGFDLTIKKCIKPGSGLGSSAASSAGAVVAANHLLGQSFSIEKWTWCVLR